MLVFFVLDLFTGTVPADFLAVNDLYGKPFVNGGYIRNGGLVFVHLFWGPCQFVSEGSGRIMFSVAGDARATGGYALDLSALTVSRRKIKVKYIIFVKFCFLPVRVRIVWAVRMYTSNVFGSIRFR